MKKIFYITTIAFLMQSCVSSLSQYQTAKTLGQGNMSRTLIIENAFTAESGPGNESSETAITYIYSRGINKKTDLGIGFGFAAGVMGFGTNFKRAIREDRLSFNFPIVYKDILIDDYIETIVEKSGGPTTNFNFDRIEFSPTLLFTYNPKQKIKNTLNFQLIFEKYFDSEISEAPPTQSSFYLSHNWEFNKNKFYFYPEIGLQNYGIGTGDFIIKFGLGFSYKRID
ncbi:hypothetical protein OBA38_00380 [bacterium]|nr:hypothetical protein [bacterium]